MTKFYYGVILFFTSDIQSLFKLMFYRYTKQRTLDFLINTLLKFICISKLFQKVPGSVPGCVCRPSHSEFSVVFSETRLSMG